MMMIDFNFFVDGLMQGRERKKRRQKKHSYKTVVVVVVVAVAVCVRVKNSFHSLRLIDH